MRNALVVLAAGGLLVGVLAGCSAPLRATSLTGGAPEVAAVDLPPAPPAPPETVVVPVSAERSVPWSAEPVADGVPPPGPAPMPGYPVQPCPDPCAPVCWSGCGLPCEEGISDFHVRGVVGYAILAGTDSPDNALYLGADVGWTSPCCWGIDAFWRTYCTEFDRRQAIPGTTVPLIGEVEDEGRFHHVGIKATYQRSFGNSPVYWYAGIGPQYFWTDGFLDDDSGFGGFGELGVGWVLSRNLKLRGGLEVMGFSTSVGRENPLDDGEDRWLWVFAPVFQVELSL